MATIEIKRGDTLPLDCELRDGGEPVDITGWQIKSRINAPGRAQVYVFEPIIIDAAAGQFSLVAPAEATIAWPAGALSMDIRYIDAAGIVMSTATASVRVIEAETA